MGRAIVTPFGLQLFCSCSRGVPIARNCKTSHVLQLSRFAPLQFAIVTHHPVAICNCHPCFRVGGAIVTPCVSGSHVQGREQSSQHGLRVFRSAGGCSDIIDTCHAQHSTHLQAHVGLRVMHRLQVAWQAIAGFSRLTNTDTCLQVHREDGRQAKHVIPELDLSLPQGTS